MRTDKNSFSDFLKTYLSLRKPGKFKRNAVSTIVTKQMIFLRCVGPIRLHSKIKNKLPFLVGNMGPARRLKIWTIHGFKYGAALLSEPLFEAHDRITTAVKKLRYLFREITQSLNANN